MLNVRSGKWKGKLCASSMGPDLIDEISEMKMVKLMHAENNGTNVLREHEFGRHGDVLIEKMQSRAGASKIWVEVCVCRGRRPRWKACESYARVER